MNLKKGDWVENKHTKVAFYVSKIRKRTNTYWLRRPDMNKYAIKATHFHISDLEKHFVKLGPIAGILYGAKK